ncbi:MAG: DUF4815 domain-containing protein [Proteobacteria bacterium]|nr:DUF4815 domain-containing protein [Pseudomonadota bacterium]
MTVLPHASGVADAYETNRDDSGLVFSEDRFLTGVDLNDMQRIARGRSRRTSRMIARDGDRISGADIVVTRDEAPATTVSALLAAGKVYADGDVYDVEARQLAGMPGTGEIRVGLRIVSAVEDFNDDPALVGPLPGSEAEGEPLASRLVETVTWATETENLPGIFYPVYTLRDGVPIDQIAPPALDGVRSQIALYDYDANGHYIVSGCDITPVGRIGADQVFSIKEGTANILGFKRVREYALRFAVPEEPDLESVVAEPHTYDAATGTPTTVTVNRAPIAAVQQVIVVKRITETVIRGAIPGGQDPLTKSSVVEIESVNQGAVYYNASADFTLTGNSVSWAPGGVEPVSSSSYQVTYLYNEAQAVAGVTDTTVTVSGGVHGRPVLVSYTSKLPRVDLICLDVTGRSAYVTGVSARINAVPPLTPSTLLKLGEVWNTWMGVPVVKNNGTRNYTYDNQRRLFDRVIDMLDQFDRSESARNILERDPVAKRGIFTDNFTNDTFRDQGLPQTAASANGVLQLAIDPVLNVLANNQFRTLPFTEEIIIRQDIKTSSVLINPYMSFVAMPAGLEIDPPVDFWTDTVTNWTSDITREFQAPPGQPEGSTTITEQVSEQLAAARFLRQIAVTFRIEGFGAGETLATLAFDGIDVKPPGVQTANGSGQITGTFTIPANIPVGRRLVEATGAAGSFGRAIFVGEGAITNLTLRRVTLVSRLAPPPVVVNVTNVTVVQEITNVVVQQPTFTGGGGDGGGGDPLAQTFSLEEPRMICGMNFWIAAIGNRAKGIRVQLATVLNGYPTNEVLAEAFIPMATPQVGDMLQARFRTPVLCQVGREYCFVIMTDDAEHAVKIARLGDVYDIPGGGQGRVSAQPFTAGVMLQSANRLTWSPVQDADLSFQVVAANFSATEQSVTLWSGAFDQVSDVIVRGGLEIPSADTSVRWQLVRADGSVLSFADRQQVPFSAYVSENVTLRAVLHGTAKLSPTIFPGVLLIAGRIRSSGTYATRVFSMGTAIRVRAVFAAMLPAGSGVTVDVDAANGVWQSVPNLSTGIIGGGWIEPVHQKDPFTAASGGRVRLTITGGPGARPFIADLRAYSV